MRLSIILLLIAVNCVWGSKSYSQKTKLSLDLQNTEVSAVLDKIEDESEFFFLYSNKLVDVNRKVDIAVKKQTINDILDQLFADTDVTYLVIDRQIVLSRKEYLAESLKKLQQQNEVTGTVTDAETGGPLPGVNIVIQGTTQGTTTDMDGNYSIEVAPDATLEFSFVGYQKKTVEINDRDEIDVSLRQAVTELEEVVAIGYGTARKEDLTGSITSAEPAEVEELPNTNVLQSLHGTVPGLNIGQTDAAGETPDIMVRGYNTLSTSSAANAPLIVVDGSIYRGNISDLNTADIESVDVLKGMSAAAVYGSQASNGVMIITTKTGTDEVSKPTLNYSTKYTYRTPNEHALEPMNANEYEEFYRDVRWRSLRQPPDYLEPDPDAPPITNWMKAQNVVKGYEEGVDEDWWGPFTSDGHMTNHNLSVQGKTEDLGYFASAGYTGEEGFIKNDQYEKYNFRINLDWEINNWMSLRVKSFLSQADHSGLEPGGFTFNMVPWARKKDDEGNYVLMPGGTTTNPYLTLEREDEDKRLNVMGNATFSIEFPFIQGLSYELTYSNNYRHNRQAYFNPHGANYTGYGSKEYDYTNNWSADNLLNYERDFGDHRFDFTLLYGLEH